MLGIYFQHFRFEDPVFHDLGRQLDKVDGHIGCTIVMYISKEAMQGMTKFVEDRTCFICTQQGRLTLRRLAEVEHRRHNGRYALAILIGL